LLSPKGPPWLLPIFIVCLLLLAWVSYGIC
jgi:hypothetical protein